MQAPPPTFLHLPDEIILKIAQNLEWGDVLRLRKCTKRLHSLSEDRSVWLEIFERYRHTIFPRPFLLPKQLEACTSKDLEFVVIGWWKGPRHPSKEPLQPYMLKISTPNGESIYCTSSQALPGGRFFTLTTYHNPSDVWYHDSQNIGKPPELLIPSNFQGSHRHGPIKLTVDTILGSRDTNHPNEIGLTNDVLFPDEFNVLVGRYSDNQGARYPVFEVWRLTAKVVDHEIVGYKSHPLASMTEQVELRVLRSSLCGKHLAYTFNELRYTVVVDWQSPTTKSKITDFSRIYIPRSSYKFYLLPGGKIVCVEWKTVSVWNWEKDCPRSNLGPSEYDLVNPTSDATPEWEESLVVESLNYPCTGPFFIHDSARLVIRTGKDQMLGLVVPDNALTVKSSSDLSSSPPGPPMLVVLADASETGMDFVKKGMALPRWRWAGYRRALVSGVFPGETRRRFAVVTYRWPCDPVERGGTMTSSGAAGPPLDEDKSHEYVVPSTAVLLELENRIIGLSPDAYTVVEF
ncbi:hypothetical protein FA15DRAFT_672617 [Coprinopsis marcescibilis]|uniref:F-box domain-containing protein n=1 Tax=Coprinopsis marcescibilis TaxID=230819 RepID=A0A5C3KME5_COPMA|nr:hypothetical protein FA15DRAFT_672617 [Coprinopsis marcescibilis]